ncbi:cytochrome c-550 PedF [Litorivita pollutaquae]|uniref:Cytochrome c-550 PedF n=1 Tax=Litorivita pollutaquae TaxID=2200892 RepID=A0A2V4MTM4_9RHOB|nr:cytochrome c-550 PedF [Litorivita pollutaquae]OUS19435.1 cytochrome c-550 PedF [Rhodobacterales bacterium 59_46_T64]PYC47558.1 cytochrome c-550 PedF [Litorivita pollutaquae]
MSSSRKLSARAALIALCTLAGAGGVYAHGDVAPQPMNTDALPDVGDEWLIENPYRDQGEEVWTTAIEIGASGYNQNCARCHGLEVISGGLAPDLRYLEAEEYGDEWFAERFRTGYTQNGTTKMPAFEEVLGQKASWAIRTYIETRPDQDMLDEYADELHKMRDALADGSADVATVKPRLEDIAGKIETLSGAPVADSIAFRAAKQLDGSEDSMKQAAETLTIGLSVAH